MLKRTLTAIVALMIFAVVIIMTAAWNVWPMYIATALIALFMLHEILGAMHESGSVKLFGYICALIMLLLAPATSKFATCGVLILTMLTAVHMHGKVNFKEIFAVACVTIYITIFMMYIPRMVLERGVAAMAFVFVIAWGSDTAAYFCGTFFGKRKLIPRVSPKKTVEGSVGAVICAALLCMLYMFIMHSAGVPMICFGQGKSAYAMVALMGIACGILSQIGDLAASAIKRDAGIKDFGSIFPGHGGFMDRFDSVVMIAPVVYYFPIVCYIARGIIMSFFA